MLALIAGRGALPAAVAAAQPQPPLICTLEGYVQDGLRADMEFRLETIGTLIARLKEKGVTDVCFCGAIDRPRIDPNRIDALTAPLVPIVAAALAAGEDGALRAIMGLFEAEGMRAHAAHVLAPHLVLPRGSPTKTKVPENAAADVAVALEILAAQSAADMGQACVIRDGQVLAREDPRGTDFMLASLSGLPERLQNEHARAGLLFKAPKPDQDVRVDLPTIGPTTAQGARDAGLAGVVIAAGGVIVLDQPGVFDILDRAGMYLWVR